MEIKRRNIVQIIADDLGNMLGCYGLSAIQTPNIDKLASEGTRFTHAFASTASCSGSRSTIYTGLHTHQNGQYGLAHGRNHFQTLDSIETLPRVFNGLGYQTGIIGKVHVGPRSVYPWEWFAPNGHRNVVTYAEEAGRFFDKADETKRSFHLTLAYHDPHRDGTRGGFANYGSDVEKIKVPDYKAEDVEIPEFITDVPELRKELAEYYKSISRLDTGVGLIMEELKKRNLLEDTLIILLSDNGAPFVNSKTTLYDAGVRLPLIVRQPASKKGVVNPNMVSFLDILPTCIDWAGRQGSDTNKPVTTRSPPRLGSSFLKILQTDELLGQEVWKQHVFGSHTFHEITNYWPTRFMRDHKFKYHRNVAWRLDFPFATDIYVSLSWEGLRNSASKSKAKDDETEIMIGRRTLTDYLFRGPEELFDLESDPEEVHNLAGDERYKDVLVSMRDKTADWQLETGDAWLLRDGMSVINGQKFLKNGMKIRDRFDFDPRDPMTTGGPQWQNR